MLIDFAVGLIVAFISLTAYDVARNAGTTRAITILCGMLLALLVGSILVVDRGTGATGARVIVYVAGNVIGQVAEKRLRNLASTVTCILVFVALMLCAFQNQDSDSEL